MSIFQAVILSIVEGITEFLPISSTGHLVLTANLLSIPQTDFVKTFEVVIQLGAIMAVVWLYGKKILDNRSYWKTILLAFIPTMIVGLTLYRVIKDFLIGNIAITLAALFIGGVVLLFIEKFIPPSKARKETLADITPKQALAIGLAQSISVVPGVSRAAATIIGGLGMGLNRQTAVEFSFLLAIPTMAAATGLDLLESNLQFTSQEWLILAIGVICSFLVAVAAVKFFIRYIQNHSFFVFGVYRIVLSIIYFLLIR